MMLTFPLLLTSLAWLGYLFANSDPTCRLCRKSEDKWSRQPKLRMNRQNEFRIAIFADLHYGEEEHGWGIDQDIGSTRVINKILDYENPDLVVLDGDLITGENTFLENSTKYLDVIVQPMLKRSIPWASTYGNHDEQFNLSTDALFLEESKFPLSYTRRTPKDIPGVTNYYVPIYPPKEDGHDPVAILWFFDSRGGQAFQGKDNPSSVPDWVPVQTVSWFQSTQSALSKRWGNIPSFVFVHIPPTAFLTVQTQLLPKEGDESSHFPGLNDDVPLANQGDGLQDIPFMQALVDTPNLHSVYSGHDHGNAWCGNWPQGKNSPTGVSKPHICFCKHSGYGGYGNWNRGSRILQLKLRVGEESPIVETWVRMEDATVVQHVSLNSTYGNDTYPLDDRETNN